MHYFLAKTDPESYSIDQFARDQQTVWDGVHNFQAINVIKSMRPGDRVFIYHSVTERRIVGEAEVTSEPYENSNDPRPSWVVDMKFLRRTKPLDLATIKAEPALEDFLLVRHSRLSTMPVPEEVATWLQARL